MKHRKPLAFLLLFVLSVTALIPSTLANLTEEIGIFLDGKKVESEVAPYIDPEAGVTLVPLRVISESLGAEVNWTQHSRTVDIYRDDLEITMTVDQNYAMVSGHLEELETSVQMKQNTVMVPLRFVAEKMGLQVFWNNSNRSVTMWSKENLEAGDDSSLKGVWVSTVFNLDWPSSSTYGNSFEQQKEFQQLLDDLLVMGMNTVYVQVRPSADALYPSSLVPWSKYLTGTQGKDPDYDPLAFMIEETHKRGMEFHAWFNPFRANTDTKVDSLASNHVAKQHPEWIVEADKKLYINPGIPQARQHIIDTIMEVVTQYDIDGVHLDDYFYPSNVAFHDDAAYSVYNSGGFNKADWRRANINDFVQQLGQAIREFDPQIEYGISPFGVWRNKADDPSGSDTQAGVTTYDDMYADVRTWIQQGWIDYVMPQIYWSLSFSKARYDKLVDWWVQEVAGTNVDLYIGHSPYKLGTKEAGWQSAQEIIKQLDYNKQYPQVKGDVFFSAKDLRRNPLGIVELLRQYYGS